MEKKKSAFKIVDYTEKYKSIMQFNKNKSVPIHQWYPFVEGYSKEFIQSILDELDYTPDFVLEPFAGSGTTPVELQDQNIRCTSFEVSPFMYLLSTVKMRRDYTLLEFINYSDRIKELLELPPINIREIEQIPFGKTLIKTDKLTKWNYNDSSIDGILDIKYAINRIPDCKYQDLFKIALASILLQVSNVFRNGKCLSYKRKWQDIIKYTREEVHQIFIEKLDTIFFNDISNIDMSSNQIVSNHNLCYYGDVREKINIIKDNSIDLIITSPPYLNSRDYTDIYMLELKMLGLVSSYKELQDLRKKTLRSHVQVKHGRLDTLKIPLLEDCITSIEKNKDFFWNSDLLNMIKGYFIDIDFLFSEFKKKMQPNKYIYFNVANSAYYGVEIIVDEIVCQIAEKRGFKIVEIRKARDLNASSQQSETIKSLRESVIVIRS
ncbi:MAG: hypothetical protein H6Q13_3180 [Bacteroidetes bacterium]|nr:hypothetical protein [Bacteroidota bacterium]